MNPRSVRAILDLANDADGAVSVDAYHADLLAALASGFGCDVAVFNAFEVSGPSDFRTRAKATCSTSPPVEPQGAISNVLLASFVEYMSDHPLIRLHAEGDRHAHRLSDVTAMRRFRRFALFGEFFRPAGLEHQLTIGLTGPPGPLVGIWLNRSGHDFSEEELLLAELLRPHLRAGELTAARAAARAALTQREREVLDLVTAGATNAQAAAAMCVSPGTVKKHLDNIYAKLGVGSRTAAADRAQAARFERAATPRCR